MEYYQDVVIVEKQDKQDYSRRMTPKKHKFPSLTVSITDHGNDNQTKPLCKLKSHIYVGSHWINGIDGSSSNGMVSGR